MDMKSYKEAIDETHPAITDEKRHYIADEFAMKLVGERHSKRELVDLVRWLIIHEAKTINVILNVMDDKS